MFKNYYNNKIINMSRGFGSFDTTYYGPTYTEDIEAIEKGLQEGMQIGTQIAQARANSIRQKADLEAQRQRDAANQATMDKLDAATREGLVLVGDTKSDNLNDARVDFSNMLVDKFNKLKIAKDDGTITAADYSKGVMTLQAQIPAYKAAERVMRSGIEQYTDALANGNLSNADNSEDIQFWAAMTRGDANVDYRVNKDGTISLAGTWKTTDGKEKPIDAELAEMDRLPFILTKPETTAAQQLAADVNTILDTKEGNTMRQMNKDGVYEAHIEKIYTEDGGYEPWFKQFAEESFDGYFSGLGKGDPRKGLKQYLMDSIEISDRKELMDKLNGGKPSESYGLNTLNDLLANKDSTFINNFINKEVKTDWLEQTKEAVIKGNEVMLNKTNQDTTKARLELEKQKADVLKAQAQAGNAVKNLKNNSKIEGNFSYANTYLDNIASGDFDLFKKGDGFEFGFKDNNLVISKLNKEGQATGQKFDYSLDDLTKMIASETLTGKESNPSSPQYKALRDSISIWWKENGQSTKENLLKQYASEDEKEDDKGFFQGIRDYLFGTEN